MPERIHIKKDGFEIRVWYLTEDENTLFKMVHLSDTELFKFNSMKNSVARRSFLAIRKLNQLCGLKNIEYHLNGKPKSDSGYISITHSGVWVGLMHSVHHEIGIDIESKNKKISKIKERFLDSDELKTSDLDLLTLTLCWSAKEAVFKKIGGDTVFFKENQKITQIDRDHKRIEMMISSEGKNQSIELNYDHLDEEYVMVYTK